jgi:TRAP-type C4-dicarboxylate transport system permease small subunit
MYALAALSMLVIVVVMAVQVFFRYALNESLIWAEELCRYVLIWMAFLFAGVAFHRGDFVAMDMIGQALPRTWRFALKVAVTIPAFVFLWLMVTNGYSYASRFTVQTLPAFDFIWMSVTGGRTLDVSIFWIYVSVSVGCALLFIHMVVALVLEGMTLVSAHGAAGRGREKR